MEEPLPPKGLDDLRPGIWNLNLGAALARVDEAGNCDGAVDLLTLGPKVELAGFVSAIAPCEAPSVGVALGSAGGAKPPKQLSKLFEPEAGLVLPNTEEVASLAPKKKVEDDGAGWGMVRRGLGRREVKRKCFVLRGRSGSAFITEKLGMEFPEVDAEAGLEEVRP